MRIAVPLLLLLAACEGVLTRISVPPSRPGEGGAFIYQVGRLSFQLPGAWDARGDSRRVVATNPEGTARVEVSAVDREFADEAECLARAEDSLQRGSGNLQNPRRHPSSLAGHRAVAQEADQAGWHGWAWAVCDGGAQYRVFATGLAPIHPDITAVFTALTRTSRFVP